MISRILDLKQNILVQPTKKKNLKITTMLQYYITFDFKNSDEEKWMKDVFKIISTATLTTPSYLKYGKDWFAISFPIKFISEVLNFKNVKDYINQLKLNIILHTISNRDFGGDILHYFQPTSTKEYPITHDIVEFYQKYQDKILSSLISEFIFQEFASMVYDDTDGNTYFIFEKSNFLALVKNIKRLYKNPFNKNNIDFPLQENELNFFIKNIYKMQDEEDNNTLESFQSEYIKILNQIIKPLARVDVKNIFHILLNNKLYEEYKRLTEVRLNKDVVTKDDIFLSQLYMKISGQPQMSFMDNIKDKKIFIFSDKTKALPNQSQYEWIEKNDHYDYELLNSKKISNLKASQKYKRDNKDISTVEIGDRYEKFCIEWLKDGGYSNFEQIGGPNDKEVDILCVNHKNEKIGVQCKYLTNGTIDSKKIRLLTSATSYYKVDKLLLISNVPMTKEANNDAKLHNIDTRIVYFDI